MLEVLSGWDNDLVDFYVKVEFEVVLGSVQHILPADPECSVYKVVRGWLACIGNLRGSLNPERLSLDLIYFGCLLAQLQIEEPLRGFV